MNNFNFKKIVVVGVISIAIFSTFLVPSTKAQSWSYNGTDTQPIPHFSVYPSEWYVYNVTNYPQRYIVWEVSHGNISDYGLGDGYSVWIDYYLQNKSSGDLEFSLTRSMGSWNDSIGYQGLGGLLPVENDGKLSQDILNNVSSHLLSISIDWEFNQTYTNPYSIAHWNETITDYFIHYNYTDGGALSVYTIWGGVFPYANSTLVSLPAQLPPEFSFTTEDGILDVNSLGIKLNVSLIDADNNNNGITDTDYQYRILVDSTWTTWTVLSDLLDYDLSSVPSGAHQITIEVKNMYGVTQEQITIQYTVPTTPDGIPGYSAMIVTAVILLGASVIILRYKRNSKYGK